MALGTFDGVHIGHQRALQRAASLARSQSGNAAALILYQRPSATHLAIESLRQRFGRIAALGLEPILVQHISRLSTPDALMEFLNQRLCAKRIVVGEGVGLADGFDALRSLAQRCGIGVEAIDPVLWDGAVVSSAALRQALLDGNLAAAKGMLGRDPEVSGRVRHGFQRGRTIGFPTANLRVTGVALPPNGVYVVRVRFGTRLYGGVANLGVNPTFGHSERTLEPHIFDFEGDLYGKRIDVQFVQTLRAELRFPGIEELVKQIRKDAEAARVVLEGL